MTPVQTSVVTSFFGTYDIRAVVGDTFNASVYRRLGRAYATWAKQKLSEQGQVFETPSVVIGYDARGTSPEFAEQLILGLNESGVSTLEIGLQPSPMVYFAETLAHQHGFVDPLGALVVTASHNPPEYNGCKFTFLKQTITSENLQEIKAIYADEVCSKTDRVFANEPTRRQWNPLEVYIDWAKGQFGQFKTAPKVVLDCGNGTAGVLAPQVFEALGAQVVPLFAEPDGSFPNHHPDPCVHKNLVLLQKAVVEHQADIGISFDGDSDRLGAVDSQGVIWPGDMILILYVRDLMSRDWAQAPKVVSEVKCSQFLFEEIETLGAIPVLSRTGHAFQKYTMKKEDAKLGGELSGHFFFRDEHWGFDDAIYGAMRLTALLDKARQQTPGLKSEALTATLPKSALSEEYRLYMKRESRPVVLEGVQRYAAEIASFAQLAKRSVETLDGIRVNLQGGFWLVRASTTEPCLTLRFEAPTLEQLKALESEVMGHLEGVIRQVEPDWVAGQGGH
jgi:phosphomannomutase / phosphoglucomutase